MTRLLDWLDHRTGCRKFVHEALYENVPGGARWRYVWGSTLTFALAVQFISGIFLWMAYSPSSQTAWESVYYIQDEMSGGWLLRGLHHYMAQAMTVLLVLHLMQVVVDGAYKAPREVNFWFGLLLLQLVLGLSLTGYLLPWDQKGFWATKVATNLVAVVPLIGPALQKIIIGGPEYGHHTLTRFFALHAGVLPASITGLLVAHIYLFRRHGLTAKEPRLRPDAAFWPDQVLKDAVACLAVLATVLFLIIRPRLFSSDGALGAELGAPADATEPYSAARPEWYFLFLFQFLKFFPGGTEIWGAIVIPTLLMGVIFLMPLIGRWQLGHRFNVGLLCCFLFGAGLLTYLAKGEDRHNQTYQTAARMAAVDAERVRVLAKSPAGIPSSGAVTLLRNDPLTQGPRLFAQKCAGCHRYGGTDGTGVAVKDPQSASDLKGFASREWLAGLLDPTRIAASNYFGGTKFHDGKMVKFVTKEIAGYSPEQKDKLQKVISALSAEAQLKVQLAADQRDAAQVEEGKALLQGDMRCTDCHQFHKKDEDATAPDLTGYGSRKWLLSFINNPAHPDLYGKRNDRMPAFGTDQILTEQQVALVADWLRGSWYDPARR
ncbi:MAG TPA: cytochrome b N-terminal domain-containing protein [Candidatus Dormibacteraeota bacterium]|nr:cytochrome b N-terminal domain-containing protein [Candidatus Dormibacteraeota bacterium]